MKIFTAIALFIGLFLVSPAMAQTPGDQASALLTQLSAVTKQITTLDSTEGKWVNDREVNLTSTKELLDGAVKNANLGSAALTAKMQEYADSKGQHDAQQAVYTPQAEAYNAQCNGTGDQNYVNSCNAWKARLEPQRERLDDWRAGLQQTRERLLQEDAANNTYIDGLNARIAQLSTDTLAWAARKKAYLADRDDMGARFNTIRDRLRQLADQYNTCTTEFINNQNNSDELIKHKCGNIQFDGAPVSVDVLGKIPPAWRMQ